MSLRVRAQPCEACPYRKDAPSGLWAVEEYDKLPPYDAETWAQPSAWFACHATPDFACHGWAIVHTNRGHEYDLLALRLNQADVIPEPAVPLFVSGAEAAEHGKREVAAPSPQATATGQRLQARYPRLRKP